MALTTISNHPERRLTVVGNEEETDYRRQSRLLLTAVSLGERALNFLGEKLHHPERPAYDPGNVNSTYTQLQRVELYEIQPTGAQFPEGWD